MIHIKLLMPLSWDENHPNILRMHIPNIRNWDEYDALMDDVIAEIKATDERVDVIVTRDVVRYRNGGLPHIAKAIEALLEHSNFGLSISIASETSKFQESMMHAIVRRLGDEAVRRFHFKPSIDVAYAFILEDRIAVDGESKSE